MAVETYEGWTKKFLSALGAPANNENLAAIYSIILSESTTIHWNPLAITGAGAPGNSVGVGNFTSEAEGIRETVNFLNTPGAQDYPGRIVKPLQAGNGRQALAGFDQTGSWTNSKFALASYPNILANIKTFGDPVRYPLHADPGVGEGDIGSVSSALGDILPTPDIDPLAGLAAIGHFFSLLAEGSTWVRIGEVLGGTILLALAFGIVNQDIYHSGAKSFKESIPDIVNMASDIVASGA